MKYLLLSIDNISWEADAYEYEELAEAQRVMRERFDSDIVVELRRLGVDCPDHPKYGDYSQYMDVDVTPMHRHVVFIHDPRNEDTIHYEIRVPRKWEDLEDDGSIWVRDDNGFWHKKREEE